MRGIEQENAVGVGAVRVVIASHGLPLLVEEEFSPFQGKMSRGGGLHLLLGLLLSQLPRPLLGRERRGKQNENQRDGVARAGGNPTGWGSSNTPTHQHPRPTAD